MKVLYNKKIPLIGVDIPELNTRYHVAWGKSNGVVGICISINEANKTVILKSPSTGIKWVNPVKWSDLRHTRSNQYKIENK